MNPFVLFAVGMAILTLAYLYLAGQARSPMERLARMVQLLMLALIMALVLYSGVMQPDTLLARV
ncbi:hypothetical protein EVB27_084 [Rhizobium phage RHph_TM16]|nr:hypothetical protein EVB27_084 [Rhizobium phage RHph_TM16]